MVDGSPLPEPVDVLCGRTLGPPIAKTGSKGGVGLGWRVGREKPDQTRPLLEKAVQSCPEHAAR